MGTFRDDDEEYHFFDAHENVDFISDESLASPDTNSVVENCVGSDFLFDVWVRSPRSVCERRRKFFRWMGFGLDKAQEDDPDVVRDDSGGIMGVLCNELPFIDRSMRSSQGVLLSSVSRKELSSSQSSDSSSLNDLDSSREPDSSPNFVCRLRNADGENEGNFTDGKEVSFQAAELKKLSCIFPPTIQQRLHRNYNIGGIGNNSRVLERVKRRCFDRLRSLTSVINGLRQEDNLRSIGLNPVQGTTVQRVKVRNCRKRLKELSGLFKGQDIQAHEGPILSMKFSPDGRYLASSGEDKIVRIWQVVEDEKASEIDIPDRDPSCIYFKLNGSELAPLAADKQKTNLSNSPRRTAVSSCIVLPPEIFRIIETPIHVFQGHTGEIVDISWSENNRLLSSSVDKTVRLWQVGCSQCIKVFPHSNYVTCVQFNPVNDNYFISGSIDGIVRVWAINDCQVVDWIDIRDIVTAVCYRPDGQGGIVGSITGICRFFSISGNNFQVEAQVCLNSKKKSPGRRITGFQFLPQDLSKVMVASADSQVRILGGCNVISNYKGLRSAGNYISASLTSNGKYIFSASEDCNVYMWNCNNMEDSCMSPSKPVRSFECFSIDASIATPWCGLKASRPGNQLDLRQSLTNIFPFSPSTYFSLAKDFCLDSIANGSATWPEEKLPASTHHPMSSAMCKSRYNFIKTSFQNLSSSHAWGMVIVTAGWDGRIRSFQNYGLPVPI